VTYKHTSIYNLQTGKRLKSIFFHRLLFAQQSRQITEKSLDRISMLKNNGGSSF